MRAAYESDFYFLTDGSRDRGYADYASQEKSLRLTFRSLLRRLDPEVPKGGSLLEIGCGYGWFLDEAGSRYPRRMGTDMSAQAAARARALGIDVVEGGIEAVPDVPAFDAAVALQVIEHVYDPITFVRAVARRVKPGGLVLLSTPNMASLWRRLLQRRWPSFKIPEHVAFYDGATLSRLALSAGLTAPRIAACTDFFPLSEVLRKLGLPTARLADAVSIPFRQTSVCIIARRPEALT